MPFAVSKKAGTRREVGWGWKRISEPWDQRLSVEVREPGSKELPTCFCCEFLPQVKSAAPADSSPILSPELCQ